MKVIFRGLGPSDNIVFKDKDGKEKLVKNGAIVDLEEDIAKAYIGVGLAYEVVDENEAKKIQKGILKNNEKRKELEKKEVKKGGKK